MQEDQLEQDKNLPIANISRIMKQALPTNTKVSKEAKETIQECLAEFIGFITNEATEKCHKDKRKSINGDDILQAMQGLGFDTYMEPLKVYLHRYREAYKNESEQTDQIQTHQQVQTSTQESAQEANQTNSE